MEKNPGLFKLRLPEHLRAPLEEAAKAHGRTLTGEILHRLEQSLNTSVPDQIEKMTGDLELADTLTRTFAILVTLHLRNPNSSVQERDAVLRMAEELYKNKRLTQRANADLIYSNLDGIRDIMSLFSTAPEAPATVPGRNSRKSMG